jgi:oxygen-dependent protoporphyrinogen oxidase
LASVVVLGAGIAGLTCAWRLQRAGHDVEVLERERTPGGRMRSERRGAYVVDRGAQFIASGYRNLHQIARSLGLGERIENIARTRNAILRDGALRPGDYDSLGEFLRSDLLSRRAKARLPRLLLELLRHRKILDPMHPEKAAEIDRDDMARYLRRVVGEEALEYLLAPAFSSTFDSDPEDLSGAFALLAIRFLAEGFRLQCFAGGCGLLTRTLADRLSVRVGWEALAVETDAGGARVRYLAPSGERSLTADAAVVAVPGSLVAPLCPKLSEAERRFFAQVRYVRGIIAYLLLEEAPETLPYYGVAFPRSEGLRLYGLAVDHHKPGAAPEGAGLVNVALRSSAAERLFESPDEAVLECVLGDLARTPVGRLEPVDTAVHRWDPMMPQFHAGYLGHLRDFLGRSERSPRLAFAGDYLVGPYTEAALTSGMRAANEIARALERT